MFAMILETFSLTRNKLSKQRSTHTRISDSYTDLSDVMVLRKRAIIEKEIQSIRRYTNFAKKKGCSRETRTRQHGYRTEHVGKRKSPVRCRTKDIDWRRFRDLINSCIVRETRNRTTCREASLLWLNRDFPDLRNARIDPAVLPWPNGGLVVVLEDDFIAILRLQEECVRRSTEVEHSNLISCIDLPQLFSNLASGHLRHSDPDEGSQLEVKSRVWLDDVHGASGCDAEPGLRTNQGTVRITWYEIRIVGGAPLSGRTA